MYMNMNTKYFHDNRPSYHEYALLSSHVYDDDPGNDPGNDKWSDLLGKGWDIHKSVNDESTGYFGRVYINESTKQIVVAHRGTKSFKSVLEDVFSIFLGGSGSQRKQVYQIILEALQFLFKEENHEYHHLSFTGHSLGAFLADVSVLMAKRIIRHEDEFKEHMKAIHFSAVTFESPGCERAWKQMQPDIPANEFPWKNCDIINFMSFPNAINAFNRPLGTVYLIPIDFDVDRMKKENLTWLEYLLSKIKKLVTNFYTYKCHSMANILHWFRPGQQQQPLWMMDFTTGCTGHKFIKKFIKFQDDLKIKWDESNHCEDSDISFKNLFENHFSKSPYDFNRDLALRHFAFQEPELMQEYTEGIRIFNINDGDGKVVRLAKDSQFKDVIEFRSEFSKWLMLRGGKAEKKKLAAGETGGDEWIQITVKNDCGYALEKVGEYFSDDCGRTDNELEKIETGQVRTIAVSNRNGASMVKGILRYNLVAHPDGVYMIIYFDNPYNGCNYHNVQFWNDNVASNGELYVRILKVDTENIAETHWANYIYGSSLMTDGNDSTLDIALWAATVRAAGQEISFRSYHNTYLRANRFYKSVDLAPHCRAHEKWQIIPRDGNKCSLKSCFGTYLRANDEGHVDVSDHCKEWEEWTLVPTSGGIKLRSRHGKYLQANNDNNRVKLVGECKEWELWNV